MVEIQIWVLVLSLVGALLLGAVAGFFGGRYFFKKELEKNPPINENMIRAMFRQMGRKPSESQIKAVMNAMKNSNK